MIESTSEGQVDRRRLNQYDVLIVSDLHLSEGRNPATKKFSTNEDFFFDEEFARFLNYHQGQQRQGGRKWHLIINGDFLDFLQVTSTDIDLEFQHYLVAATADAAREMLAYDRRHLDYGYGCGPKESVYKLWKIMDGHWLFFEALADYLAEQNAVTIIKGNHDAEFYFPEVQAAFRSRLKEAYERKLAREQDPQTNAKLAKLASAYRAGLLNFSLWFYYEPGLLWVEHGNQYDKLNCFRDWLVPLLPRTSRFGQLKQEIDLPWGSLFVRYLFNKVESGDCFADNIKPATKFISWFLTHEPLTALRFLLTDGWYMASKMRRSWRTLPGDAYRDRDQAQAAAEAQLAAGVGGMALGDLQHIAKLRRESILKEDPGSLGWRAVRLLVRWWLIFPVAILLFFFAVPFMWISKRLRPHWEEPDTLGEKAQAIAEKLNVRYVVMGHTHDNDLHRLVATGGEYFNTGTWTKVFSEAERLIREESELVFVRGLREDGRLKMHLLKWNDAVGEPRLVKLFETKADRRCQTPGVQARPAQPATAGAGVARGSRADSAARPSNST